MYKEAVSDYNLYSARRYKIDCNFVKWVATSAAARRVKKSEPLPTVEQSKTIFFFI